METLGTDRATSPRVTARVEHAEVASVEPDSVTITFVTDPGESVSTRLGDQELVTSGPHHVAYFSGLDADTEYSMAVVGHDGPTEQLPRSIRTLTRPSGAPFATFAT